jgi:hypothetical protein
LINEDDQSPENLDVALQRHCRFFDEGPGQAGPASLIHRLWTFPALTCDPETLAA